MKSRRRQEDVSEDRHLVKSRRRCKEPSKISLRKNSDQYIPVDLVMEILSRLPAKSITRCRCLSKLWASMLCRPDFTELFLTRSTEARRQILFTCHSHEKGELVLFSSPQPQYSDGNSSSLSTVATASYLMKIPFIYQHEPIWHINGLVFFRDGRILKGRKNPAKVSIMCSPSTRQSLVLSKEKTRKKYGLFSYYGYDPVEKQFKVLSIIGTYIRADNVRTSQAFQVLTLGTKKKMSWRKLECCIPPHIPSDNVICINGVLYYEAAYGSQGSIIVCFDVRSEKLHFMIVSNYITAFGIGTTLINYNGKLASFRPHFSGTSSNFVLWILTDTEKHEWSQHIHEIPPWWKDVVGNISLLDFVGVVNGANEIVFSPHNHSLPFYVFYYNIERDTIRRVEIQGLEGSKGNRVHTFLNHVENIKPYSWIQA